MAATRPEYSTVKVDESPVLGRTSPPPNEPISAFTGSSSDYPNHNGDHPNFQDEAKQGLLGTSRPVRPRTRSLSEGVPKGFVQLLIKLMLGLCAAGLTLSLLIRLAWIPSPTNKINASLGPYIPASVRAIVGTPGHGPASPHPILPLISHAREAWSTKLSSQSTSFARASQTYKLRYKRDPPPGFDKWFAFATQGKNHTLVDEYDSLMGDLAPFRALSATELKKRTAELAQLPGISIVSIRSGVAQVHAKSGKWAPAIAFQEMINDFVRDLPDMDFAINEKPEGRVLPRRHRRILNKDYGILENPDQPIDWNDPLNNPGLAGFTAEWKGEGSTWEAFRRACGADSSARKLVDSVRSSEINGAHAGLQIQATLNSTLSRRRTIPSAFPPTREMTFNLEPDTKLDICNEPSLHTLHSAFYTDQRSIEYLYPVFSASKPAGYADILIPPHQYWTPSSEFTYEWELKRGRSHEKTDMDWSQKKADIYYRGKATKGADPAHESSYQKQRLVKMANTVPFGLPDRVLVAFDDKTAALTSTLASAETINQAVVDIAMACDPVLGECAHLRSQGYRIEAPAPLSEAWKHKFVLDLDEVGFSPKFSALMESNSAVIKSSIQREFWREWAQPWKHFIPLSSSYSELYNLGTFFNGFPAGLGNETDPIKVTELTRPSPVPSLPRNEDGTPFKADRVAEEIARAGSEWRTSHLRRADMECYVYRLMIE